MPSQDILYLALWETGYPAEHRVVAFPQCDFLASDSSSLQVGDGVGIDGDGGGGGGGGSQ